MIPSLTDLRYFRAMVAHGSLTSAGQSIGISQPALSKCLRRLEGLYGNSLLVQTDTGLQPTEAGRILLEKSHDLLFQAEDLSRQIRNLRNTTPELRIGAGPFNAEVACRQAIARFMSLYPAARVTLVIAPWNQLLALLREDNLQFYVAEVGDAILDTRVEVSEIKTGPFRWICRPDHPLARKQQVDAAGLTEWPIAGPILPTRFHRYLLDVKRLGASPVQVAPDTPLSVVCDNWSVLKHVVMNSTCVGLSTEQGIRPEIAKGDLCVIDSTVELPAGRNGAVRRKSPALSADAEELLQLIADEFDED